MKTVFFVKVSSCMMQHGQQSNIRYGAVRGIYMHASIILQVRRPGPILIEFDATACALIISTSLGMAPSIQ